MLVNDKVYHKAPSIFLDIVISKHLRLDKGTETGDMATTHAFIWQKLGYTGQLTQTTMVLLLATK